MIQKNVPLASQVIFEILAQIDSGDIVSDHKELPSEAELSQRFGISRSTIREALAKLELGGAITRQQGIGTYVSPVVTNHPGSVRNWLNEAPNFIDLIQNEGFWADCTLLNIGIIPAGSLANFLEITAQSQVVSIERVFIADASPVIHSANFVSLELIESHYQETVCAAYKCTQSIYEFLQQWCNSKVYNQKSEIRAVLADEKIAGLLNCSPGAPLLRVEEIGYGSKMKPIFYGLNHFRGDKASFVEMRHPTVWLRGRQ